MSQRKLPSPTTTILSPTGISRTRWKDHVQKCVWKRSKRSVRERWRDMWCLPAYHAATLEVSCCNIQCIMQQQSVYHADFVTVLRYSKPTWDLYDGLILLVLFCVFISYCMNRCDGHRTSY